MFHVKINIKSAEEAMQKSIKPMLPRVWNDVLDLFPIENQQTVLHALLNLFGMAMIDEKVGWAGGPIRTNFIGLTVMDEMPEVKEKVEEWEEELRYCATPIDLTAKKGPWMQFMDIMASDYWIKAVRWDEQHYGEIVRGKAHVFQSMISSSSDRNFMINTHAKGISKSFDKSSKEVAPCASMLGMCRDETFDKVANSMLTADYNPVSRALVSEWKTMDFNDAIADRIQEIICDELENAEEFGYLYKLRFRLGEKERALLNNITLLVQRNTKEDCDQIRIRSRTAALILKIAVVLETMERMHLKAPKKRDVTLSLDAIVRAATIYSLSRWTADKLFNIRKN